MIGNTKIIEALENTFDSNIDDWVEEVMWDYELEDTMYDREIIKKILKFGYYTSVHAVEEL